MEKTLARIKAFGQLETSRPKTLGDQLKRIKAGIAEVKEAIAQMGIHSERERIARPPITLIFEHFNKSKIYGLDFRYAGGSSKCLAADNLLKEAEARGEISPEKTPTLIYASSGNSAIWLTKIAKARGYKKVIIVTTDYAEVQRLNPLVAMGAEIRLIPGELGYEGAFKRGRELEKEIPGSKFLDQSVSPDNHTAFHKQGERAANKLLWHGEKITHVIAPVGTGGTFTGLLHGAQHIFPDCQGIAVEVTEKPYLTEQYPDAQFGYHLGFAGTLHRREGYWLESHPNASQATGMSANIPTENLTLPFEQGNAQVVAIQNETIHKAARHLARAYQQFVGPSTAAAFTMAREIADLYPGACILIPICDSGERYSGDLWHKQKRQIISTNLTPEIIGSRITVTDRVHQNYTTNHLHPKELGGPLSTADMLMLMEVTCRDLERSLNLITAKQDSFGLGTSQPLSHQEYVPLGAPLKIEAEIVNYKDRGDKKIITYQVQVFTNHKDGQEVLVGTTEHTRCILDTKAFRARKLPQYPESKL